jgi:hypothetical protein
MAAAKGALVVLHARRGKGEFWDSFQFGKNVG